MFRTDKNDGEEWPGVSLHLLGPELLARGLEHFTIDGRSLIDVVRLPAFEPDQPYAWPPPRTFDSALFAPMPHDRRYSAEWGVVREEQTRAVRLRRERGSR